MLLTGGYVKVCDSLYDDLAGSTKVQLAQCYQTLIDEFGRLEVDIPPVQTQTGSVVCYRLRVRISSWKPPSTRPKENEEPSSLLFREARTDPLPPSTSTASSTAKTTQQRHNRDLM
jgi:hypothetical protein